MSCQLDDQQIQSWLDGDCDLSQHVQDCPECQQRMSAMQRLRSRLTPPPSPLGRDFARRTAQHILKVSDQVGPTRPWSLRENPLVHIVQRERARRMLRAPHPAAVLLLYLLPAAFVFNFGDDDARWAYFGFLRIGLTVLVPLLLLSLEWVTLSSLVRGRCLEEILQTGLRPALVSDTLALSGLRSLIPVLLATGLALVALHPQSLLVWLPITLLAFVSAGYLSQAHLLAQAWPRWLSLLGAGAVAGSLAAPLPWNLVSASLLGGMAVAARQSSQRSLSAQQQGLPARRNSRSVWGLQSWLAQRLPQLAVLQRELQRRNLFTFSMLTGNLGVCLAAYTMFGWNAYSWPLFAAAASLLCSFSLVNREKDAGAFEILLHSGLQAPDWWRSAQWLSALQMFPALLVATLAAAWQARPLGSFSLLAGALGTACSLLVSLHAGSVIGTELGLKTSTSRQAAGEAIKEVSLLGLSSLLMIGIVPVLMGHGSPVMSLLESFGVRMQDALDGFAVLPVMLALYLRSRSLRQLTHLNPLTAILSLSVPASIWTQISSSARYYNSGEANFYAGLSLMLSMGWCWWAAPLASRPGKKRWAALVASFTALQLLGLPMLVWCCTVYRGFNMSSIPQALQELEPLELVAICASTGWFTYLVGLRNNWHRALPAGSTSWKWRTAWAGGALACLVAAFGWGMQRLQSVPRLHASEHSSFLERNREQKQSQAWMKQAMWSARLPQHLLMPSLESTRLEDNYLTREYTLYSARRIEFSRMFDRLAKEPALGNQQDREWAISLLELQCNDHLRQRQTEAVLQDLQQMGQFCHQADAMKHGRTRMFCLRVRSRSVLACRSLTWNEEQLRRLEGILNHLPDDETHARQLLDRAAAKMYERIRSNSYWDLGSLDNGPIARFYLQQEAELFLDHYLDGQSGRGGYDLASNGLWQLNWSRQREADQWKLGRVANSLALDLERIKLAQGHYPATISPRAGGLRLSYRPTADGSYDLKVWLPRPGTRPLILTCSGSGYHLRNAYEYYGDD